MNEDKLIPELHDVGKLLDNEALAASTGLPFAHHYFSDRRYQALDLLSAELPVPNGPSWAAIRYHGGRVLRPTTQLAAAPKDVVAEAGGAIADVYLTVLADHLAASTSRPISEDEARETMKEAGDWPKDISVRHCLWRDEPQHQATRGPLLSTTSELHDLLAFVAARPDAGAFYERYGRLLDKMPEEKGFPGGVTTLRTHCDLVGRFYWVLRSATRQTGRGVTYAGDDRQTYGEMERHWRFRRACCRIHIPAIPARLQDLGVFQRLETALDTFQNDPDRRDHVLLATFQDVWLFLPIEAIRSLEDVLKPLLDAGFQVEADVREAPLANLISRKDQEDEASKSVQYFQSPLDAEISPPLCDVCQLAQGQVWQKRQDNAPEYLCAICAETRERYSQRFQRLEEWNTGYAVWVRVFLDFDALDKSRRREGGGHLQDLFRQYVAARGNGVIDAAAQEQLVKSLRTTALSVDYTNDFLAMQQDFAGHLESVYPPEDVEALTSRRKELILLRLDDRRRLLDLLQLFHVIASRHFPRSLMQPPFRLTISAGPVKFPFGEHWRLLQQAQGEVTVYLVGAGRLSCSLATVPELLSLARAHGSRRALHRLADIAAESRALAEVALKDREERDLAGIAGRLRDLGLDFESMAVISRLSKERL